jgi:hypothetical protein
MAEELEKSRNILLRGCIQKFPDLPPGGARTANGTAVCHWVQIYRYFMSQSSEFFRHNPLCSISTSVYCCKHIFHYRLSPETFGYTPVRSFQRLLSSYFLTSVFHIVVIVL